MFFAQKYILFIEKSKLSVYKVIINKDLKSQKILETRWSDQTLPQLLFKIKKKINKPIRILLADEFVYTEIIKLPKDTKNLQEEVKAKAQERIPDILDNTIWDFKEFVLKTPDTNEKIIQFVALTKTFYDKIQPIIKKIDIKIEAIEPVTLSFARFLSKNNDPLMIINISSPNNIIMIKKGLVLASDNKEKITSKDLKTFLNFVKIHFSITPKAIYFCGNTNNLNLKNFDPFGIKTEIHTFDPVISLALKTDINNKNETSLNLRLNTNLSKNSNNTMIYKILTIIIFLLLILFTLVFLWLQGSLKLDIDNWLKNLYAIYIERK